MVVRLSRIANIGATGRRVLPSLSGIFGVNGGSGVVLERSGWPRHVGGIAPVSPVRMSVPFNRFPRDASLIPRRFTLDKRSMDLRYFHYIAYNAICLIYIFKKKIIFLYGVE